MLTTAHEKINDNKTVRKIGIKLLKKYSLNGKLNLIRINTILKNNAIKLTTAYIYWPDGTTNIHGKGIKANLENSVLYEDGYARALAVSNG